MSDTAPSVPNALGRGCDYTFQLAALQLRDKSAEASAMVLVVTSAVLVDIMSLHSTRFTKARRERKKDLVDPLQDAGYIKYSK